MSQEPARREDGVERAALLATIMATIIAGLVQTARAMRSTAESKVTVSIPGVTEFSISVKLAWQQAAIVATVFVEDGDIPSDTVIANYGQRRLEESFPEAEITTVTARLTQHTLCYYITIPA